MKRLVLLAFLGVIALLNLANAQNVTGSLVGTVLDQSGAPVPGAQCTLTNKETSASFTATSAIDGAFNFPIVPSGTYNLDVRREGLKAFAMRDIGISANEVRTIGRIVLEVGSLPSR